MIKQRKKDIEIITDAKTYRINRAVSKLNDNTFLLFGSVKSGTFYTLDVPYFRENLMAEPWYERMRILDNEFEWNNTIKYETPLVATSKSEFEELIKTYTMSPDTDRILVKEYDSMFLDNEYTIEVD